MDQVSLYTECGYTRGQGGAGGVEDLGPKRDAHYSPNRLAVLVFEHLWPRKQLRQDPINGLRYFYVSSFVRCPLVAERVMPHLELLSKRAHAMYLIVVLRVLHPPKVLDELSSVEALRADPDCG